MLLLAWDQPPIAIGAGSFLGEIVELAGGRNLFDDLDAPSAPVSLEAIAIRDPDLVLTSSDSAGLTDRPEWQVVRAVRERRFVRMTGTEFMRPTPRAASAVTTLARVLEAAGWR
jgi:ABC-type Fe3+-hydroxamate transport system substrate-binding protein